MYTAGQRRTPSQSRRSLARSMGMTAALACAVAAFSAAARAQDMDAQAAASRLREQEAMIADGEAWLLAARHDSGTLAHAWVSSDGLLVVAAAVAPITGARLPHRADDIAQALVDTKKQAAEAAGVQAAVRAVLASRGEPVPEAGDGPFAWQGRLPRPVLNRQTFHNDRVEIVLSMVLNESQRASIRLLPRPASDSRDRVDATAGALLPLAAASGDSRSALVVLARARRDAGVAERLLAIDVRANSEAALADLRELAFAIDPPVIRVAFTAHQLSAEPVVTSFDLDGLTMVDPDLRTHDVGERRSPRGTTAIDATLGIAKAARTTIRDARLQPKEVYIGRAELVLHFNGASDTASIDGPWMGTAQDAIDSVRVAVPARVAQRIIAARWPRLIGAGHLDASVAITGQASATQALADWLGTLGIPAELDESGELVRIPGLTRDDALALIELHGRMSRRDPPFAFEAVDIPSD